MIWLVLVPLLVLILGGLVQRVIEWFDGHHAGTVPRRRRRRKRFLLGVLR